jgi:hypothetical protein
MAKKCDKLKPKINAKVIMSYINCVYKKEKN